MVRVTSIKVNQYLKSRIYAEQSEAKILKKIIIEGHRSTILRPQYCKKNLVLGPYILGSGEPGPPGSTTALSNKTLPSSKYYVL